MRIQIWPLLGLSVQCVRLFRSAHNLTSWPSGLRVRLWNQRNMVDSQVGNYYKLFFSSFLALQCKITLYKYIVIWNYINGNKLHSLTFYIELSSNFVGVGLNLALLRDYKYDDPRFFFIFF